MKLAPSLLRTWAMSLSVDSFIERVLPHVDEEDLAQIKALLVEGKHINKKNRWTGFSKDPKQSAKSETKAFQALPTVFGNIVKTASTISQNSQARLRFVYKPNDAPASERNNDTRPNGQLELMVKKSLGNLKSVSHSNDVKSHWEDIVLPFEFKLDEKDYLDVSLSPWYIYTIYAPGRISPNRTIRNSSGVPTILCGLTHAVVLLMGSPLKMRECVCGSSRDPTSW
jgi:hypothetical protein